MGKEKAFLWRGWFGFISDLDPQKTGAVLERAVLRQVGGARLPPPPHSSFASHLEVLSKGVQAGRRSLVIQRALLQLELGVEVQHLALVPQLAVETKA